jgi:DNA repair photolyase
VRWQITDDTPVLFADEGEVLDRRPGTGQFAGMEFLHVRAKRIINEIPGGAKHLPFQFTINVYRGCSHACSYCLVGETPILMANGRTKPLADLRRGDRVYGTVRRDRYRRYVITEVLDHWSTFKRAFRITLADGTQLIASGDHRFLTDRGWKHVTGSEQGASRRPHLTTRNRLIGTGKFANAPRHDAEYKRGYLCGVIRGDASLGTYTYTRNERQSTVHRFRLALADHEPLARTAEWLSELGIPTKRFIFSPATERRRAIAAIRTSTIAANAAIRELIVWPGDPSASWARGFLAGLFDAEGSCSKGVLRFSNTDEEIIDHTADALARFGFDAVVERGVRPVATVRVRGGHGERLRFFHTTDPSIERKQWFEGMAVKVRPTLQIVAIEDLGVELPMFDITTGTGDFIANGVISHNCFARPTHAYLDMDIGDDFDRRIVVKVNAAERLRAELRGARWRGDHIAMGTNTDPYQRCEGKYRLTRAVLEVLADAVNPFGILTKSTLVLRDLDVLADAAARTDVHVNLSIGTLDEEVWRLSEPGTPHPLKRVDAVARLNEAGIRCGVLVAPVLPALSDSTRQINDVVKACAEAGAASVTGVTLHLRPGVREHYLAWLERVRPDLVSHYQRLYPRTYAPADVRKRIAGTIRRAAQRYGVPTHTPVEPADVAVRTPAACPSAKQMTLDLT